MSHFFLIAPISAIIALGFVAILIRYIIKKPEGDALMVKIAKAVRQGAEAYIKRQYSIVGIFFGIVFVILLFLVKLGLLPLPVPFAFLTGGLFSGLAGYIGLSVSTRSSSRTTEAAKTSLNRALKIALSSGMTMGLVVVGLALLYLAVWYLILDYVYKGYPDAERIHIITSTMLNFGMGASFQALFARVGGGIFTKAADVGADLVGKTEKGIPEDDPRNPAVIADNVGDNVGDVAGMGADLYESYTDAIVASMALAVAAGLSIRGVILPMAIAGAGIIASILGFFFVRVGERAEQSSLLWALRKGVYGSSILVAIFSFLIIRFLFKGAHLGIYFSVLSGLVAGVIIGFFTEFFTSENYSPTLSISKSAVTGAGTVIIEGISVGMLSTAPSVIVVALAVLASFFFAGGGWNFNLGLYGVGIAAVGMLSTLGITLATDAYGPVADNAGGNAEMSNQKPIVRERTDALDALGNTTAATGKGFAIGSAALTALALLVAYRNEVSHQGGGIDISIINPRLLVGIFIGAMLVFWFSSLIMRAIGRAAEAIVLEVRRQFKEIEGLMEGRATPDYKKAVEICTKTAQKQMILPSISSILAPIIVGILIGVEGVMGLLAGAITTGFGMAIFMANAGGAWDNAKKYIEKGHYGGKGSEAHKAGVIGDTVGDPFKDAAGPSLNILIKLMAIVSIVFLGLTLSISLFR